MNPNSVELEREAQTIGLSGNYITEYINERMQLYNDIEAARKQIDYWKKKRNARQQNYWTNKLNELKRTQPKKEQDIISKYLAIVKAQNTSQKNASQKNASQKNANQQNEIQQLRQQHTKFASEIAKINSSMISSYRNMISSYRNMISSYRNIEGFKNTEQPNTLYILLILILVGVLAYRNKDFVKRTFNINL